MTQRYSAFNYRDILTVANRLGHQFHMNLLNRRSQG